MFLSILVLKKDSKAALKIALLPYAGPKGKKLIKSMKMLQLE